MNITGPEFPDLEDDKEVIFLATFTYFDSPSCPDHISCLLNALRTHLPEEAHGAPALSSHEIGWGIIENFAMSKMTSRPDAEKALCAALKLEGFPLWRDWEQPLEIVTEFEPDED